MTSRYTYKALEADIKEINDKLDAAGATRFLEAGSRYNSKSGATCFFVDEVDQNEAERIRKNYLRIEEC